MKLKYIILFVVVMIGSISSCKRKGIGNDALSCKKEKNNQNQNVLLNIFLKVGLSQEESRAQCRLIWNRCRFFGEVTLRAPMLEKLESDIIANRPLLDDINPYADEIGFYLFCHNGLKPDNQDEVISSLEILVDDCTKVFVAELRKDNILSGEEKEFFRDSLLKFKKAFLVKANECCKLSINPIFQKSASAEERKRVVSLFKSKLDLNMKKLIKPHSFYSRNEVFKPNLMRYLRLKVNSIFSHLFHVRYNSILMKLEVDYFVHVNSDLSKLTPFRIIFCEDRI